MKTKLFFIVALLGSIALIPTTNAQVAIKAGVNIASISQSATIEDFDDIDDQSVVGFQGGLAFDLNMGEVFSLQPEVLYIQKGGKTVYKADEENKVESRLYYNYVEVPVLLKLKFFPNDSEGAGFYLLGGPFAGLALGGKIKTSTTIAGETTTAEEDFEFDNDDADERQRRLDWGVAFGGGVQFGRVFLDARYNLGINNLLDNDADNDNDDAPYRRTRGIGLTLGYQF